MRLIPKKYRDQIARDPFMEICILRSDGNCHGRITWEHPWIYGGKQIVEPWATVPLCWRHHLVKMDKRTKDYCRWISLMRANFRDLSKYPKKSWETEKEYLRKLFLTI